MLHRIQLGRKARQPLQGEADALGGDEFARDRAAMSGQAVPDHQQRTAQVRQQVSQNSTICGALMGFARCDPDVIRRSGLKMTSTNPAVERTACE